MNDEELFFGYSLPFKKDDQEGGKQNDHSENDQ